MTPNQFKQALKTLGLNPTSAGRSFGVSRQHIHNIINGSDIPKTMSLLIEILLSQDETERKKWIE